MLRTTTMAMVIAAAGVALAPTASAQPDPVWPFTGPAVYLTDVPWIDALPVCAEEDCSDQPGQVGVWTSSDGLAYIEIGEGVTVQVIDNTAV